MKYNTKIPEGEVEFSEHVTYQAFNALERLKSSDLREIEKQLCLDVILTSISYYRNAIRELREKKV